MRELGEMDVFLSRAAAEVIFMYTKDRKPFPPEIRLIRDTSASAAPVGRFSPPWYHPLKRIASRLGRQIVATSCQWHQGSVPTDPRFALVVAPATSNTV